MQHALSPRLEGLRLAQLGLQARVSQSEERAVPLQVDQILVRIVRCYRHRCSQALLGRRPPRLGRVVLVAGRGVALELAGVRFSVGGLFFSVRNVVV